jgi:hypothetical protein
VRIAIVELEQRLRLDEHAAPDREMRRELRVPVRERADRDDALLRRR